MKEVELEGYKYLEIIELDKINEIEMKKGLIKSENQRNVFKSLLMSYFAINKQRNRTTNIISIVQKLHLEIVLTRIYTNFRP